MMDLCFLSREFFTQFFNPTYTHTCHCPLSLQCITFASFMASAQVLHYRNYPDFLLYHLTLVESYPITLWSNYILSLCYVKYHGFILI